ncbi:MAG: hypothetical protein R3B13_25775 [Polyangiaceae bacterium]
MNGRVGYALLAVLGAAGGALTSSACSGDDGGGSANNFGGSGAAASGGNGGNGAAAANGGSGAISIDAGKFDATLTEDSACAEQTAEATLVKKPVDIIFVIDNSCSMSNENSAVEANVNQNFASIIQASGVDYRVIMLTAYTSGYEVQVGPPLGLATGGNAPQLNPPRFYHYDRNVASHNSLCLILDTYEVNDTHGLSGGGWKNWLRTEALKTFVEITDDGVSCNSSKSGNNYSDGNNQASGITSGDAFDTDLLALDPTQFGTAADRNYVFHSILGIKANTPSTKAYDPTDPFVIPECPTGVDPGTGYQQLSIKTGGLRFPVCEGTGFDAVFQKIAEGVIKGAQVACEIDVPQPPPGEEIDLSSIRMKYTPSGGGADVIFEQVPNAGACKANAFYIEADKLKLCPQSCTTVQADNGAKLQTLFGCTGKVPA